LQTEQTIYVAITQEKLARLQRLAAAAKKPEPPKCLQNIDLAGSRASMLLAQKIIDLLAYETRTLQEAEEALQFAGEVLDAAMAKKKTRMERILANRGE
jgi:hypothetical protein